MAKILGISAYYHDSAACIVVDGNIIAAAQEERFSRKKHDPRFPRLAIEYCLAAADMDIQQLDAVVFYDKPLLKFERLLETYLAHAPKGFLSFTKAMPIWLKEKLYLKSLLRRELRSIVSDPKSPLPKLLFTEHHQSHAASAFYPSPFQDAAVVCLDGVGEWATTSVWHGRGAELTLLEEIHFPHSLGLLYSAFTYYCGFRVNAGEYKLMGLAPYGEPSYVEQIYAHLIDVKPDGSFRLNMRYFDYAVGKVMTNRHFHELFGAEPLAADSTPTQKHCDLARSIQVVTEEVVIKIAQHAKHLTGAKQLCLAGGVALNCVANAKVLAHAGFDDIWIQPAAGDAGGALGAALEAWYSYFDNPRDSDEEALRDSMQGAYLGPEFDDEQIAAAINHLSLPAEHLDDDELFTQAVNWLSSDKVVGWFQGRMEFGPRALGNRSILGDARSTSMQRQMNVKIKQRESFRPFAPIVLAEKADEYFDFKGISPYMLLTAQVKEDLHRAQQATAKKTGLDKVNEVRSTLPAITHIDYSARLQTVEATQNARLHRLLTAFEQATGTAVLINTSFNVRGEPPVCSPADAIRCFLATDMDYLVMGNWVLAKSAQPQAEIDKAKAVTFEKD
ncbi:carbamoyltransferase [Alteromonas flava]|uniref:carbamoyltransferase family protein n=1 Tax=Alteromonas flava TaxID=2048003 RepID=UPI000C28DA83|nr:carbamoyltransferase [Alteromonas flava]